MPVNREVQRLKDENRIEVWEKANLAYLDLCADLDEATEIIQALVRLIAGWEHVPAVPAKLQERAEAFGADWSE